MVQRKAAVFVLGLAVLLGLTAWGWIRSHGAACGSPQLRWTWTRPAGEPSDGSAATLSATNKSSHRCVFDGYPQIHVWVGKAQDVQSEPEKNGGPVMVVLNPGRTVDFPLFYQPNDVPRYHCWIGAEDNASSDVVPPHPRKHDYGSFVHVTDAKGHPLPTQVCSDTLRVGPPQLR
jgi:hypothetical protein